MVHYSVKKSRGRKIKKYRKSRKSRRGEGRGKRSLKGGKTRRRTLGKRKGKGRGRGRGRRMMGGVDEEVAEVAGVAEVKMTPSEQSLKDKINTKYRDKFIANGIPNEGFSRLTMLNNQEWQRGGKVLITNLDKWISEKHKMYNLFVYGCYVDQQTEPTCYALVRFNLKQKEEDKILFLFKDKSNVTLADCDISSIASSTYGKLWSNPEKIAQRGISCFKFKSFISSDSHDGDNYSLAIVEVNHTNRYIVDFFNMLALYTIDKIEK
jgi:hypothetical protein